MWASFLIAMVAAAVVLAAPGVLFFRALRFSWCASFCVAPVFTLASVGVVCVAFGMLGVSCSWVNVFGATLFIGAAALLISFVATCLVPRQKARLWLSESSACACEEPAPSLRWRDVVLYLAVACVAVLAVFVMNLDGAASYPRSIDTAFHFSTVRAFIDSGYWSSLGASPFTAQESLAPAYLDPTAFYPAVWHELVAMVATCAGVPITLAANAVEAVLLVYVFPCAMYYTLAFVLKNNRTAILCGAVAIFCFSAFPWRFVYWGVLYPNLLANCIVMPVAIFFAQIVGSYSLRTQRIPFVLSFVVGIVALALTQTNVVFTAALFMIP